MRKILLACCAVAIGGLRSAAYADDWWPWSNENSVAHTTRTQMLNGKPVNHVGTPAIDHSAPPSGFQQIGSGVKSIWNQATSALTPAAPQPKPATGGGIMRKPPPTAGQPSLQSTPSPAAVKNP